jgi:chromosome segregation ATPase
VSVDREYRIKITTEANNAAAQQSAQELKDVGKATKEAGEHTEKFNTHGREMHEVLHKLNEVAPGLGQALKAVLSPEAAPIIGLIVAMEFLQKLFERMKRDAEEFKKTMEETPDFSGIKNSVESIAAALEDADRNAKGFISSMEEIESAQKTIAEKSADMVTALEHQKTVEEQIAKAKKDQVTAELELMKQKGQITPEQYDIAKIKLESASARESAQREVDYLNKEKEQTQNDRDAASHNVEELGKREKAAQERVAAADNNLDQAKQRKEHAKSELEKVTEAIAGSKDAPGLQQKVDDFRAKMYSELQGMNDAELRSYYEKLKGAGSNTTIEEGNYRRQLDQYLQLSDKLQDERRRQSGFAGKVRGAEGDIENAKSEKSAADKALEDLNKEIKGNADSVRALTQKLDDLGRKLDEHKDDSRVFDAQDRARRAQALPDLERAAGAETPGGASQFAQRYFDSINRLNQGKGSAADENTRQLFVALSQASKESDQAIYTALQQTIQDLINHKQRTVQNFQEMTRRMDSKGK